MAAQPIETEVLRESLIFFVEALKLELQKVYSLTIGMQSLLEALRKHAPDLYQKYEEAYPVLARKIHVFQKRRKPPVVQTRCSCGFEPNEEAFG